MAGTAGTKDTPSSSSTRSAMSWRGSGKQFSHTETSSTLSFKVLRTFALTARALVDGVEAHSEWRRRQPTHLLRELALNFFRLFLFLF